jgi:ATP-dependent RNA helicase RhlE
MPDTADAYTHRVGRTGRVDQTGEALTLAQPEDEPIVREVERVLGEPLPRRRLEGFNYGDFNPEAAPRRNGSGPKPAPRPSSGNGRRPSAARAGGGRPAAARPSRNRPARSRPPRR